MTSQAFADYHLYTIDGTVTLRDRETQSLVMLDPRPITVKPRYLYRGNDGRGVVSQLQIVNSAKEGAGVPLPAGRVRFFESDAAKQLQFTGETTIGHTAVDEKLTLDVGTAFDLAAERRSTVDKRISDREREFGIEIKLRNRKSVPVTIVVEESLGGDITLAQQSHPSTRKDASTLQFSIDGEYRYTYSYQPDASGRSAVVRAIGDLDCDGTASTYELEIRIEGTGVTRTWTRTQPYE